MPAKVANRLLASLPDVARANTNILLGYPEESVGRMMSPRYVSLRASSTTADALTEVRRAGLRSRDVLVLPVTDDQRRLVGVLTVDDAMEVIEQEETEDFARAGGVEPLTVPYMEATVLQLARKRATWLLVLIIAAVATVNVLGAVAVPIVWFFFDVQFALVIGSTLFVICTWASVSGGLLPLAAKRIGIDPAVVSAPLITTLVDATGLIIYFLLAQAILGIG
ncbi:MAG: magnesium transporter [Nitriliruptoraceae bacterium]|nr:magnesium transporter [Nitriliruptoraceae bacterium]